MEEKRIKNRMKLLKPALKILLPLIVLVICFFVAKKIIDGKVKVKRHVASPVISVVDAEPLVKSDYRVIIESSGTVRAKTESAIVPEVSGKVVEVSMSFREGGYFERGDVLLCLDPRNYETDVTVQVAELAKARQMLTEEEALSAQAIRNWERLSGAGQPRPLVAREPQLLSAKAELKAAEAKLKRARLDLKRTCINAPYAGRVLEKSVDIGEYVTAGVAVARIYSIDYAEIRLPLSGRELEFVELPELYRGDSQKDIPAGPAVDIVAKLGSREFVWSGVIVRSEGAIDEKSRQLFIVAEVKDPYAKKDTKRPLLKVGQFVEARLQGRLLKGVFVVTRRALRNGSEVFIVKDEKLERRKVDVVWKDKENIVITGGVESGELVVTTPAVYMKSGKVKVAAAESKKTAAPAQKKTLIKSKKPAPSAQKKTLVDRKKPVVKKAAPRPAAVIKKPAVRIEKPASTNVVAPDAASSDAKDWDIIELEHLRRDKKPVVKKPVPDFEPVVESDGEDWHISEFEHLRRSRKPATEKPVPSPESGDNTEAEDWDVPELEHLRRNGEEVVK